MKLIIAIAILWIADCKASYYYDLAETFGVNNPGNPPEGATVENGPNGKGKVFVFGPTAPPVYLSGPTPTYIITALSHSEDFTYYTEFKMPEQPLANDKKVVFFSLLGIKNKDTYTLFSIGLKMVSTSGQGAENEEKTKPGKFVQVLFVSKDKSADADLTVKDEFKPNTWYNLMIRIRPNKDGDVASPNVRRRRAASSPLRVQVRVNCKEIGSLKFETDFKDLIPYGFAAYGSSLKDASNPTVADRFPGPLRGSQIINGVDAFAYFSPCDSKFKVQKIPSEPRPSDYSDLNLQAFLKASSGASVRVSQTCPGTKPVRYRGQSWKITNCLHNKCDTDGKVVEVYLCPTCIDSTTNKKYLRYQKWIDPKDKCQEITCLLGASKTRSAQVICNPLTKDSCNGTEPLQLDTECCLKCGSDTCSKGKQYYEGCKIQCEDAPNFSCSEAKLGCWCPKGSAENEKGECIDIGQCPCRSGTIVYQSGQSATRSSCTTCVCNRGEMKCFDTC